MIFTEGLFKSENPKKGFKNPGITKKALYRYFQKSSQTVILYIYDHIPSKNPECSPKKPGGSFSA